MSERSRLHRILQRFGLPVARGRLTEKEVIRQGRRRLLMLLFLFDALLIVAVLLSFQETELVEQEITLVQTREVYDIEIRQQVITHTTVITQIIPYGAQE